MTLLFTILMTFLQLHFIFSTKNDVVNFKNNACYKYFDYTIYPISRRCFESPWVLQNAVQFILNNGYQFEEHSVQTDDGYILRILRVFNKNSRMGQPVYIQHGIVTDASAFLQSEKNSLAFNLVELGYDVWLGNLRTTLYGKQHVTFNPKSKKFWNFSLDELAKFDVRNTLQKIANVTEKGGKILYIGHSMGTTLIFMYQSEFPSDNLVKCQFALSPVAYWPSTLSSKISTSALSIFGNLLKKIGINYLLYDNFKTHKAFQIICKALPYLCLNIVNIGLGQSQLFLPEQLTIYFSNFPDTVGLNQLIHLASFQSNGLKKFDYGSKENLKRYGDKKPPLYDLKKINVPTFMFYGKNDNQLNTESVERLRNALGSQIKEVHIVPINNTNEREQFGHIQFLIGANITELFYKDLYQFLARCAEN